MSTSSKQVLANQQNAEHSTGPRTREGKRAVSLNALRHGLTSQLVVLPNEDHSHYIRFSTALKADLKPEGTVEKMLAQTVCDTQWRLERGRAMESTILAMGHLEAQPTHIAEIEIRDVQTAMVEANTWARHESVLRNIHMQETRLTRALYKAMAELREHQARRKQEAQDALEDAVAAYTYHKQNQLTFIPSEFGFVFTTSDLRQAALRREWRQRIQ